MKKIFLISIAVLCLTIAHSRTVVPTLQKQLESLNKFWKDKNFDDKILKERILLKDEVQLIQTHLSLVEQKLRNSNSDNLSEEQKANRLKCLDILNQYWTKGVFPKNIYHAKRTPYFIDHLGTACAVGQLIIETGYKDFAKKISAENNYGYIKELNEQYPEVKQWADKFGFTVSELAWIQPSYNICYVACTQQAHIGFAYIGFDPSDPGIPPYTYLWNPTGQTTNTAKGLCPGTTYSCTVIDSHGDTIPNDRLQIGFQGGTIYPGNVIPIPAAHPLTFSQTITKCAGQDVTVGTHTYTVTGTYKDTLKSHQVLFDTCDSVVTTHLTVLYSPSATFSQTLTICGQSLVVGTATYTTSGTYTYTFHGNSCDSTVNTNLTLLHKSIFSQTFTKCVGQGVTVGMHTYTVTGTYKDTLRAFNSCDSIVTTHLTVLPKRYLSQTITKCAGESVTVGTNTYTITGTYTDTLTASNTCDSIITTHLTVLLTNTFSQTITKCAGQSVTVGIHTYSVTGTYIDTLTAFNTCDSIVTTNLTVLPPNTSTTQSPTICAGDSVRVGVHTYTISGTYKDTISSCNSTVTTHLTVLPANTNTQVFVKCAGQSITVGAHTYTGTGAYTDTLTSLVNGCDSILTTILIINPPPSVGSTVSPSATVCVGTSVTLTGTGAASYNWSGGITDAQSFTITSTTTYSVTGTDANNCSNSATKTITVKAVPTVSINGTTTLCRGTSTTLSASGATTYLWSNSLGTIASITVTPTITKTYTVTGTDSNNCKDKDTITVTILPIASVSQSQTICLGQSLMVGTHTYNVSGTYHDTLTRMGNCDSAVTTHLAVLPKSPFSQSLTICSGRSLIVGTHTYSVSGTYHDTLTTTMGTCDSIITTHLTVSKTIHCVTGIDEWTMDNGQLAIYPNPTTGIINIERFPNTKGSSVQIEITDVLGNNIYEGNSALSSIQIDLSSQANGVYFISIQGNEGIVNRKIVISK